MESGFRAAQAFVQVYADLDERGVLDAARRAAQGMDSTLTDQGRETGRSLTTILSRAGDEAGAGIVKGTEKGLRDSRGRFVAAGLKVSEDVRKGAADDSDRNGFHAFTGFIKAAPKVGGEVAKGLMSTLEGGVKGPAGPVLIAALSGGALLAGPWVGGLLAGGILAGIAAGGVGAGIALEAQDPEIKNAFGEAGEEIAGILKDAAHPFHDELLDVAERGRKAFQRWDPMLRQIFGISSTLLDPFVDMVEGIGDRLLPTIMTSINSSRPAVMALTGGVLDTVDAVADLIDMLGDNGPEAAVALKVAFYLLGTMIRGTGVIVNGLAEGFGKLIEFGINFIRFLGAAGASLQRIPGPLGEMGAQIAQLVPMTSQWQAEWGNLKGQIAGATDAGISGTRNLSDQTILLNQSMGAAIREAGSLSEAFRLLNGGALNAREAESAYQEAIDNATRSMKENGKTLNLNTEKGRANDQALRQLITSTDQLAQATYEETAATQGSAAAESAAARVYEQGRQQLIKSAMQMGMSRKEAEAYANRLMKIPKSWNTNVDINDKASPKAKNIRKEIERIHGRTVTVTVKYETHGDVPGEHIIGRGTLTKYADGGEVIGGSGYRDDVPLLATGGEWVIKKSARMALERTFGAGIMDTLNSWGDPNIRHNSRVSPAQIGQSAPARTVATPVRQAAPVTHLHFGPGSFMLDLSKISSLQELVDILTGIVPAARGYGVRSMA